MNIVALLNLLATFSDCVDSAIGLDQAEIAMERACYESVEEFYSALDEVEGWIRKSYREKMTGDGLVLEVHWFSRPEPGKTAFLFPSYA